MFTHFNLLLLLLLLTFPVFGIHQGTQQTRNEIDRNLTSNGVEQSNNKGLASILPNWPVTHQSCQPATDSSVMPTWPCEWCMSSVISLFGRLLLPAVSMHCAASRIHADGTQYFGGPKCVSHDQLAVEPAECRSGSGGLPCSCLFHRLEMVGQKMHAGANSNQAMWTCCCMLTHPKQACRVT